MSWKVFGQISVAGVVIGGGIVGMSLMKSSSRAAMSNEPYSSTIAAEERVLEKVHNYCFPLLENTKDEATCKLWLRKYRELDKFAYSDSDEYTENVQAEAVEGESKILKLSKTPGNAQSPAE